MNNLLCAWKEFLIGKAGKPDVQLFGRNLMDNIFSLHEDLVNRSYQHGPYHSFFINDPKRRHIHKASVRDRLLHHAVYRMLYPFFDRTFIADSYSCRNEKGMHRALNRFREFSYQVSRNHTRTCWVLKCDIKQFFASVDQGILMQILVRYIPDVDILNLLTNILDSFHTKQSILSPYRGELEGVGRRGDETFHESSPEIDHPTVNRLIPTSPDRGGDSIGLPLGNLTSQLFTNIYMNEFDHWVKHRLKAKHYIRYADDFVFLSEDREWLVRIIPEVRECLSHRLSLTLHPKKIILKTVASGVDFLGWVHFPDHRVLRTITKRRMLRRIKHYPTNETVQSYLGLLSHGNAAHLREQALIHQWLWQL